MLSTAGLVLGIVALSVVWFVVLWLAICYGVARAAGWGRLRQLYETGPFEGPTSTSAGYVGASRYRGRALIVGASPAGLYLNVSALFRVGTSPVLIPWHDVTVSAPSRGPIPLVTFELASARTSLRVPESAASKLLEWQRGATYEAPIRHEWLSEAMDARIRKFEPVFAEVYRRTHEEWLDGFQRDVDPEPEVAIWEAIASAYQTFTGKHSLSLDAKREALGLLLVRTGGNQQQTLARARLQHLSRSDAEELLRLYSAAPQP